MYLSKALADAPFDFLAAGQRSESFWVKLWEELGADLWLICQETQLFILD